LAPDAILGQDYDALEKNLGLPKSRKFPLFRSILQIHQSWMLQATAAKCSLEIHTIIDARWMIMLRSWRFCSWPRSVN